MTNVKKQKKHKWPDLPFSQWAVSKAWPGILKWCREGIGQSDPKPASLRLVCLPDYEEMYAHLKDKYFQTVLDNWGTGLVTYMVLL